jgi:opacity protein-like surface antigen
MRRFLAVSVGVLVVGALVCAGVAEAQTASADPGKGYAEIVAQSSFGNVTSQNYGGEFGYTVVPNVQVFAEFGHTRNVATSEIDAAAQTIASAVAQTASNVGYSVKQPMTFGVGGVKYLLPLSSQRLLPYAMAGFGAAHVTQDARFTAGGTDVTNNMAQFGVVLGGDLSGSFTKAMFTLGGGVTYPVWQSMILDFQFRYGHLFASGESINSSRAGLGVGLRF